MNGDLGSDGVDQKILTGTAMRHLILENLKALRNDRINTAEVIVEAMNAIADTVDAVYVSVDIDVVDSSHSPGTGAPVFAGITAPEFLEMMKVLGTHDVVGAIDLCEVAPPLDSANRTAHLAANGLLAVLDRRLFDFVEVDGSERGTL